MKLAIAAPAFLALIQATVIELEHIRDQDSDYDVIAKTYAAKFQIQDELTTSNIRALMSQYKKVQTHNSNPEKTWRMALNKYSHLTDAEFSQKMLMKGQNCSATTKNMRSSELPGAENFKGVKLADFKDWRTEGNFVTPVKNQGHCGSCWTFSSTGCLESAWAIHRGELISLAEQQFVDCAGNFDNNGCSGGLPSHASQCEKTLKTSTLLENHFFQQKSVKITKLTFELTVFHTFKFSIIHIHISHSFLGVSVLIRSIFIEKNYFLIGCWF